MTSGKPAPNRSTLEGMEPFPSDTPFITALRRYLNSESEEDAHLERDDTWSDDTWWQNFFEDCKQNRTGENFSTPATDPVALTPFPTSLQSLSFSDLPLNSIACSEFHPIRIAASEGIEAANAGFRIQDPAFSVKDPGDGIEDGPEIRQQSLEVASPVNTSDWWSVTERNLDKIAEAIRSTNPSFAPKSASLRSSMVMGYNPGGRASYRHPEPGDPYEPPIFCYASRSELSRGNSTGARYNAPARPRPQRGHRSGNWKSEEKDAFLELKVEAQNAVKGKSWDFISVALKDRYDFERSAKSCEDLWGTLLKLFKVIRLHESQKLFDRNWCSYWELDENGRLERQLPKAFSFKWYEMIKSVLAGKGKRAAGDQQWTTKDPSGLTSLEGAAREFAPVLSLADHALLNPQRDLPDTSTSNTLTMSKEELKPYLQSVVIDALQAAFEPLDSILQCEDEEVQEFDAKMKALNKKRRALDLEEMLIKRQRVGQYRRTSRSSCRPKQAQTGLQAKKASTVKIIPAFEELNIAGESPKGIAQGCFAGSPAV